MSNDTTLRLERLLDAPVDAVFEAWTSADAMLFWYRERPEDEVRVVELDVRVGGRVHVEFGPPGQPPYVETGTYLEIDPPRRVVMTETLTGPDGIQWESTRVSVTLEPEGGKTRLVLLHEGFPSREHRDGAASGWPGFLDRLEEIAR